MKILAISLLRLGDVLLTTPVLRGLKKENPGVEIHILINKQFGALSEMLPYVSKVHVFDREIVQKTLGSTEQNLIEAYYRTEDLVDSLRAERFDKVINLTHNRFSGWIAGSIDCADTRGVTFGLAGKATMGSKWFEYLNDFTEPQQGNTFHFVDIFHYGSGLNSIERHIELRESSIASAFASQVFARNPCKTAIFLQPCTSESKKTLVPSKWKAIGKSIISSEPHTKVFVLGAPSEKAIIDEICEGGALTPIVCDLAQAYSLLSRGQLLITGDTSIKHLACATSIKIIEISIGSSEYNRTGAYTDNAVILQGNVGCAPCSHRTPCHQKSHLCEEKITPELVSMVGSSLLRRDENALRMLAFEYKDDVTVLKTSISDNGDWSALPLARDFSPREISSWIDRSSFKLLLQGEPAKAIGEVGSEGMSLKKVLENVFPERSSQDWTSNLKNLERDVMWMDTQLEGLIEKLRLLLPQLENTNKVREFMEELIRFCGQMRQSRLFASYSHQFELLLDDSNHQKAGFNTVKKVREKLNQAHQRSQIELKLIRGLQIGFTESL